jgi:hypothetical protein
VLENEISCPIAIIKYTSQLILIINNLSKISRGGVSCNFYFLPVRRLWIYCLMKKILIVQITNFDNAADDHPHCRRYCPILTHLHSQVCRT